MAFTPLSQRLSQLPVMLAGPILRQVTKDQVTVWAAFKESVSVTLNVWNTDKPSQGAKPLMTKATATTAIGLNLHIVAVTARATGALSEGNIYFYNLSIMVGDIAINLSQAVTPTTTPPTPLIQNPFAYGTYALPSFTLPPADLSKLRLIHGSCRKPHAPGDDALPILDDLIAQVVQGADEAYRRPHQLILSGDQIYADDVSDSLLLMLMDASNTLMGWQEVIPFNSVAAVPNAMEPYKRQDTLKAAGFTSDDLHSQLMSLGEYFAMYLFVWSDVLWPDPKTFDTFAEMWAISFPELVNSERFGDDGSDRYPEDAQAMDGDSSKITQATNNLKTFCGTVWKVRRALANIPTYMICDDHEVTDDWNMTRGFCEGVYNATNKLGLRVLQNALVAYSVCQAWGNLPEQFEAGMSNTPGQQLLSILGRVTSSASPATPNDPPNSAKANSTYTQNANQLMTLVGLHSDDVLQASTPYRVFHDPPKTPIMVGGVKVSDTSLRFNFSIEGDGHQVIVTDTRTWRAFPESKPHAKDITHADFLPSVVDAKLQPASVQDLQLGQDVPGSTVQDVPPLNGRLLLVVVTTNIPPIASIRAVERLFGGKGFVYENDLRDSWEFPSAVFDRMIVYLDKKTAKAGPPNAPVVFLSGDVHFAFSLRLSYWADKARLGDPQGQGTPSKRVFLQLVCSSLKNQDKNTLGLQDKGYNYHPHFFEAPFTPPHVQEGFVGWNVVSQQQVGTTKTSQNSSDQIVGIFATPDAPTMSCAGLKFDAVDTTTVTLTQPPDYRYLLDYQVTASSGQAAPPPPGITISTGETQIDAANATAVAAKTYMAYKNSDAKPPQCIGHNNLGEVGFSQDATTKVVGQVIHTLHWQLPDINSTKTPKPLLGHLSSYVLTTDINDKNYVPIKAPGEP